MKYNMYEDFKKLSDEELLAMYELKYSQYTDEAMAIARKIIKDRNISKAFWYYRKNENQYGPITRDEIFKMALEGDLCPKDYVWFEGLGDWILANHIPNINFKNQSKIDSDGPPPFTSKEGNFEGVKIAAILLFIESGIWGLITLWQIFLTFTYGDYDIALIAGWNIVMTTATFFIGRGIWNRKEWGYRWGMGSSVLGLVWYGIEILSAQNYFLLIFIPIYVAIIILLKKNKSVFKILAEENKSKSFFDISEEQHEELFKDKG